MRLHRNIYLWYVTTFLLSAVFTLPIWVIFSTDILGLNNTQTFLLGVLPTGLSIFFEIPSGTWADKYGRVRIFQIGIVLYTLAIGAYLFTSNFYILLLFQAVGALGLAMKSGSLEALVHDSIDSDNKDTHYAKVHGHKMAIGFISRVIAVLAGGYLFTVNPKLPFVFSVGTFVIGVVVACLFKEVRTETPSELSAVDHFKSTFMQLLRQKMLLIFCGLALLYTFCAEAMFSLYQPYLKSIGTELNEFGLLYAVVSLFSAVGALSVGRLVARYDKQKIVYAMLGCVVITLTSMLLQSPLALYIGIIPSSICFGFSITLINTAVQKLIRSKHHATALSIVSFGMSIAFFASSIFVGVALDMLNTNMTINVLLGITGLVLLVFPALTHHWTVQR